ncbi:MAG: hypothetical protein ACM3TN_21490 [Alphaproteobacteria bacterium]
MWAITSYYNFVRSKRRLSNYRIFRANLRVPLVTVELSFDDQFELTDDDADVLIQISGGALLWQKERLLNIAIKSIPPYVKNIAWLDCDVIFENPDWAGEAELQLSKVNIVQLFSDLVDLGPEDYHSNVTYCDRPPTGRGIISVGLTQQNAATWEKARSVTAGLAWAARRGILKKHGFYDAMIVGGGDTSLFHAMYGQFEQEMQFHRIFGSRQEHYLKWARQYHRTVGEEVGYVPGRIYHLWHGKIMNRNYLDRHRLLADFDFDPDIDLRIGANGAWEWARPRRDLEDFLRKYFISRAEVQ